MNCAELKELLVAYVEDLLDEQKKRSVAEHLKGCVACQAELKDLTDFRNRLVKNGSNLAKSDLEDDIMNRIVREQSAMLRAAGEAGIALKIRRIIMKSPITKLAVAALIVAVVLISIHQFGAPIESVALADVLKRVEQARAFTYKMKGTVTGLIRPGMPAEKKEMNSTVTVSNDHGIKMEMIFTDAETGQQEMTQQMYFLIKKKEMFIVMPEQKKYTRMEFDDDLLARMKAENNDPREMIKQIMKCQYIELGRSVINGVKVEGFETRDPVFSGGAMEGVKCVLWVDVDKWLPVRAEMEFKMNEQTQMSGVLYDYQWDIPVEASEFEPVIPDDFTGLPTEGMKMPSLSEEAAVEGLRMFGEISGKYPKNLNMMTIMQDVAKLQDCNTAAAEQLRLKFEEAGSEEEQLNRRMEIMKPAQSLGMFYIMLVRDGKEPAYYGESVGPADADKVLLRWKVAENQYRVLFGDLTIEEVVAEELTELER